MLPRDAPLTRRSLCLLAVLAATTACARAATPAPTGPETPAGSTPSRATAGRLAVVAPLALDRAIVGRGERVVGRVTYANEGSSPVAIRNLVIVARPADGTPSANGPGFTPGLGATIVAPGQRVTLTATLAVSPDDQPGDWYAAGSYQDAVGDWHESPADVGVAFSIRAPASPPAPPPPTTAPATATRAPSPAASILETPGPLYWGAYIDGVPWHPERQDAFEGWARKRASLIHWGQAWWHDGAYQPFYASDFDRVRGRGALPLLDWGAWDYSGDPDQPAFSSAAIARGDHDAYIAGWAAAARVWGHPLFLRFNHEMNGWWQFPWSERLNGNRPGDYVRAWRHVHDIFAAAGATNVTWVWCVNVLSPQTTPLDGLYPGDAYVDWVAMDGYNWGSDYGNTWQPFAEIFGPTYTALRRLAPAKPIMIAEIGCQERGGDKAAWVRDALGVQLPARFPAIKAVAWFNWDDNDPIQTGMVESSAASIAAFGEVIGGSAIYLPGRFADSGSAPIPPPGP